MMASSMIGQRTFCFTALLAAALFIVDPSLITITYPKGTRILAEVADTPAKRASGLMFRDRLAPDRGMLFVGHSVARTRQADCLYRGERPGVPTGSLPAIQIEQAGLVRARTAGRDGQT